MYPWRGGLAGMAKTAAREWAGVRFRAIDVDEDPDAAQLLRELAAEGPVEIGYRCGRRLTIEAIRQELPESQPPTPAVALTSRSVVLVTGGARGITGEAVRELAERTGATFILLGRSPAPHTEEDAATACLEDLCELRRAVLQRMSRDGRAALPRAIEAEVRRLLGAREIRHTLAAVRDAGARAEYISCDVQDARALEAVVRDVGGRLGGIDAILHGAGVIEDSLIAAKDPDSFDRVWRTKVLPLVTLARVLDPIRLQLVMLFSSIAGFFGNPGQADYAAANEALNRMARRLAGLWPAKVVAMNWGPWSGAGMVRPEVARQFEDRGVPPVTVPAGRRAVWQEVLHRGGDDVRVLLGPGPWLNAADRLAADSMSEPSPLLADQAVHRLPGGVVEARIVLDADRHAYLRDHQIDGQPVLPLTVALELLAEVASAAQPDWHVTRVSNLRMFSGVVLEDRRREVMLRAEPIGRDPRGGEWRVRLTDPRMSARPLYEATVRMAPEASAPPTPPPADPIDRPPPLVAGEVYRRWLFHGPLFQAIEQLRGLDARGVDAVVRPSSPRLCLGEHVRRGWLIDPVVLDAAPQVALIWSRATRGTSALPSRIGTYHRYGPMGNRPLEMIFRVDGSATDGHTIRATAWFVRDGRVVGLMEGLEGAASAQLNRIGADAS
jgi:NAD(P)-dependent dehydrogenase (short-subunit alcohol dehydrogenase family)